MDINCKYNVPSSKISIAWNTILFINIIIMIMGIVREYRPKAVSLNYRILFIAKLYPGMFSGSHVLEGQAKYTWAKILL